MRALTLLVALSAVAAAPTDGCAQAIELRGVAFWMPAKRDVALDAATAGLSSGPLGGFELSVRGRWLGISADAIGGSLAAPAASGSTDRIARAEARVQVGPRLFSLEGGYVRRVVAGPLGATPYSCARAGAASLIEVGGTGLTARLAAGVYLAGQGVSGATVSGHEIVTSLEYRLARTPLVLTVGYRAELFTVTSGGTQRGETLDGIVLGGGIELGS